MLLIKLEEKNTFLERNMLLNAIKLPTRKIKILKTSRKLSKNKV